MEGRALRRAAENRRHIPPSRLRQVLSGGDRRSIGRADEVAAQAPGDPALFDELIRCMADDDPVIAMRAADAAQKAAVHTPALLATHSRVILGALSRSPHQEVRWHVAQMIPCLSLSKAQRSQARKLLMRYLDDASRIVRVCAMQALADLTRQEPGWREEILTLLRDLAHTGSPAVRARARKLIGELAVRR